MCRVHAGNTAAFAALMDEARPQWALYRQWGRSSATTEDLLQELWLMLSERAVRETCRREHQAIRQCCMEWDRRGACSMVLESDLTHHAVVLYVLREYLAREYHRPWH